jgi:hypothetical protein
MAFLKISGLVLAAAVGLSLPIGQAKAVPANGLAATVKQVPQRVEHVAWCGRFRCWSTGWGWRRPYAYWGWRRPYAYWGWRRPLYAYAGPAWGFRRPLYATAGWGWRRPYWGWRRPLYAYAGPGWGFRRPLYGYGWRRPLYAYAGPAYAGPAWGWRRPLYAYAGGPYWGWRRPFLAGAVTTGIGFNPWYGGGFNPWYGGAPYAYVGWNTGWRGWGMNTWW